MMWRTGNEGSRGDASSSASVEGLSGNWAWCSCNFQRQGDEARLKVTVRSEVRKCECGRETWQKEVEVKKGHMQIHAKCVDAWQATMRGREG